VHRERGLWAIIVYKFVKAVLWFALAATLAVASHMGNPLVGLAAHLRHHAHAWSLELADLVVRAAANRRTLPVIEVALVADGLVGLVEGWALFHGRWWGPWLVVVATGSLLPFEVVALVRHAHLVRVALFAVNLAIVWYLARMAMRERRLANGAP
jgi:uncharacterized membrane protein (DUF2068 family)